MNKILEKAFNRAETLPNDQQGRIADALLLMIVGVEQSEELEVILTENGLTHEQEREILIMSEQAEKAAPISTQVFLQELRAVADAD
jgi:hypothetical protein